MSLQDLQDVLEIQDYAVVLKLRCAVGYNPDYFAQDEKVSFSKMLAKQRADGVEQEQRVVEEQKEREGHY